MTNVTVPSITTATPAAIDTVLGIKSGVLQRFSVGDITALVTGIVGPAGPAGAIGPVGPTGAIGPIGPGGGGGGGVFIPPVII
jgi:hypothetical protein